MISIKVLTARRTFDLVVFMQCRVAVSVAGALWASVNAATFQQNAVDSFGAEFHHQER